MRVYPTRVDRYLLGEDARWELVAEYPDAQISDSEASRAITTNGKAAYLRVYHDDIANYSETHIEGAGIHKENGLLTDCDGDTAVERLWMDAVLSTYNFGSSQEYVGIVSFQEITAWGSGTREVNEWRGHGNYTKIRIERWVTRGARKGD